MRINRFSEARGIFESEEFSLEPHIYCFGDDGGGGGGGGDSMDDDPDGDFDAMGGSAGDFEGTNFGGDTATAGGSLGGGGDSNDNDGDGIPNSIDATPGTPSGAGDAFDSVGAAYDEAVASIAAGEDAFGPGGAAGYGGGDDGGNDADNDGIPDTIDIDAGTGTGTPVDGVDIFDPGFDDTDLAETIEIAPPTIDVTPPSVASDVDLSTLQAINQERLASGGTRQVDRTYNPRDPQMGQGTGVPSLTGDALRDALLGPQEQETIGSSLVDSLFEDLTVEPETFGPADITVTTPAPDFNFTRDVLGVDQSVPQMSLAPETMPSQFDRQARMGEVQGPMSMARVEDTRFSGIDMMRQADDVLAERAIDEAIFGDTSEIALPTLRAGAEIINQLETAFGANQAQKIADVAARPGGAVVRDPQTGEVLGAVGPESNLSSALFGASDAVYVGDPRGYDQGVEIGKTILGPDTNVRDVPTQDPFGGGMEGRPGADYTTTAPAPGSDGDARQAQTTEPDISCPEGFEYDPVSDSCVVKQPEPRIYGPATVDIAAPTLTQYTQMAAPRPTALQPSQLIAPRPIDPLTGRPFRDGGIVSVAKFAEGGKVTSSDIAYLQGLVQAGDRNVGDFVSAIDNYIGTSTSELPESIQTALKVREQLRPIQADVFEKYGFDRSQYDKYINRGLKGLGEDRNFATNSYFVYNPTDNKQMVSNTGGMTIENADAMRSLLRVMDQYNSSTGGAYGSDKQNLRLNFTSGDKFDLLVDGRKLGNFSGSSEGMQNAADSMVSYLSGAYAAPELSQVYQAKQQMQSLPTYEGQSAYKDLAQQTLNTIVGKTDAQDWMDINKDDQVNISDAVQLLKYGSGLEEVPDDIFMLTPQGQIASLQDKYGQLESTYNTLTSDYGTVTGSMRDLEEQLAKQTQETETLQGQLTGMEGYIDPDTYAQATGQISDLQTQLSGLEGYVDPTTYGNLQSQLDQRIADYNALNTTYGTTQEDLNRAASQIQELQSTIGNLSGQKQQAQTQALIQQYGQAPDYSQYTQPAQSFMPQAAQTTPYTQYAPPAGIAGLQPTLGPTLAPPQFVDQPALDIPLLQLPQLDPLMPVPYAPPELYNPFAPPTQNFGR